METLEAIYIFCYMLTTVTLAFASGRVYPNRLRIPNAKPDGTAWQVRRAAAILIGSWILSYILFLPVMFLGLSPEVEATVTMALTFIVIMTVSIVSLWSVNEFLQFKTSAMRWLPWTVLPELVGIAAFLVAPSFYTLSFYFLTVVGVTFFGVSYFYRRYQRYKRLLREEYSDLTHRELRWVWGVCIVMAIQSLSFVVVSMYRNVMLEFVGMAIVIACATLVAQCAFRTEPLSLYLIEEAAVEEHMMDARERTPDPLQPEGAADEQVTAPADAPTPAAPAAEAAPPESEPATPSRDEALDADASETRQKVYDVIRHKLQTLCVDEKVFLDPDLTREMLCSIIKVNRTYLSDYLRSEGTTYYNYINSLRIQYAVEIMRDEPTLPLVDVSYRSGYSNPATFRRAFRDIMGCLPSEYEAVKA